jgi:F0F1-type ATP synthase membrane subunit c/vacuolar-type H+-ATPase subunit K
MNINDSDWNADEITLHRLRESPQFRKKSRQMTGAAAAFFASAVVYAVLLALDVMPRAENASMNLWWVLVVVGFLQITAQVVVFHVQEKALKAQARDFESTSQQGFTMLVVALAFPEAVCVYGLISPILGAPDWGAYGLWGFGIVYLAATLAAVRPRVDRVMLTRLAREEGQ